MRKCIKEKDIFIQ